MERKAKEDKCLMTFKVSTAVCLESSIERAGSLFRNSSYREQF